MTHRIPPDPPYTHLLHIETRIQMEPNITFGYADVETVLLNSIEEVREEIRRRYHNAIQELLLREPEADDKSPLGMVYSYEAEVDDGRDSPRIPHQDLVRVYEMPEETIPPEQWYLPPKQWMFPPQDKESHLEEKMTDALQGLLACTELHLDEMEPETRKAIACAETVLKNCRSKQ